MWYFNQVTDHTAHASFRCLLVDGLRGEGLASPPPPWVPLLLLEARVVLASAVFFLVLFVEGDVECGWFLLVAGGERGACEFWSAVRGCDVGRDWNLQVAVWRRGAFERRLLASVVDVSVIMQLKFQRPFVEFYRVPSASVRRQSGGYFSCFTETGLTVQTVQNRRFHSAVLCEGLDMPVLCVSSQCSKLWSFRSCSSSTSLVHVRVVMQRLVPMVQTVLLDGHEVWAAHYFDDELCFFFFQGPVHRYRAGDRVRRDTATMIRCILSVYRQGSSVNDPRPHHNHHNHHNHHHHNHLWLCEAEAAATAALVASTRAADRRIGARRPASQP